MKYKRLVDETDQTRRKTMTTAPFFMPVHNAPMRHADGSINFDVCREIALAERRKAFRQFWSWVAAGLRPQASRSMLRGYANRLG
jgi:hypothetical protein